MMPPSAGGTDRRQVSIWCLELTRIGLEPMRVLLSADERARADSFKQPGDIDRFVKARGALRLILAERTGQDARNLAFVEGDGRKPELAGHPALHFNLSHSGGFALIAVGPEPLGVDIEVIRPLDWRGMAETVFHRDERAALERRPDPLDAFFQLWTHKEAWLKATGIGLSDHLTSISVAIEGGPVSAPDGLSPGIWYATPLAAPPGYKASIVSRDAGLNVQDRTGSFRL